MKKVFVVMSFSEEYSRVYYEAIKPAVDKNYECIRLDEKNLPGVITTEIIQNIIYADIVIADISDPSPNVFYELGISHAVGNKTISIINKNCMNNIPFDLNANRVIQYTMDQSGLSFLKMTLEKAVDNMVKNNHTMPNNIVQEAGRSFFDLRSQIESNLNRLIQDRERIKEFSQLLEKRHTKSLQNNTDVADNIVWEIKRTLPTRNHNTIVAICGSASMGKTTFANLLKDRIKLKLENSISVSVLPTDSYMYSRAERISKNISGYSPSSHNLMKLENDITDLVNGKAIKITPYSHETGTHEPEIEVPSSDVIILEGLYSFYPSIAPFASPLRYFIYAEKKQVKEMRFIADCLERSYDVQTAFNHSEIEYENYEEYILPFMRIADKVIIVDNYWKYNL